MEVAVPIKRAASVAREERVQVGSAAHQIKHTSRWKLLGLISIRFALATGLTYCGFLAVKQGISAWYVRQSSPAALESAIHWDSGNPQNFNNAGTLTHMYADGGSADEIIRSYETATRLSPQNASYWADLGAAYDWGGRQAEASAAFGCARQLFPNSPDINWRVANFYVRAGKSDEALACLRKALAGTSIPRKDVFSLAARATSDNKKILAEALTPDRSILVDYLNFQVQRDDVESAGETWHRLIDQNLAFGMRDALPYFDALIRHRRLSELKELWSVLSTRFPLETHASSGAEGNLIVNGGFEDEILNGGWDWRIATVSGANVSLDTDTHRDGGRSLRIDFDGTANLDYGHVFEYVRVKPETRYQFSGYVRVDGITTDSGPLFQIYDAYDPRELFVSTEGVTGTSDWSRRDLDFETKADTELLIVRVARQPSNKLANQVGGTLWVDRVTLEAVP